MTFLKKETPHMTIRACAGDRGGGHITCDYLVFINLEEHEFLKMECLNNVIQKIILQIIYIKCLEISKIYSLSVHYQFTIYSRQWHVSIRQQPHLNSKASQGHQQIETILGRSPLPCGCRHLGRPPARRTPGRFGAHRHVFCRGRFAAAHALFAHAARRTGLSAVAGARPIPAGQKAAKQTRPMALARAGLARIAVGVFANRLV